MEGLDTIEFPMKVLVTGTPIAIPPNQVGLNYTDIPPTLAFPCNVLNGAVMVKRFKVENKGIQDLKIDWSIFDLKKPVSAE